MSMALLVHPDRPTSCLTEPSEGSVRPYSLKRDFRLAVAFCASFPSFPDRRYAQYKSQYPSILCATPCQSQQIVRRIQSELLNDSNRIFVFTK